MNLTVVGDEESFYICRNFCSGTQSCPPELKGQLSVHCVFAGPVAEAPGDTSFPLVNLNIASSQYVGPIGIGRRFDTESVRSPRFAAVVNINGEGLCRGAGWADDRGSPAKCRVLASRCCGARQAGAADRQAVDRFCLDPDVDRMVVVFEVAGR